MTTRGPSVEDRRCCLHGQRRATFKLVNGIAIGVTVEEGVKGKVRLAVADLEQSSREQGEDQLKSSQLTQHRSKPPVGGIDQKGLRAEDAYDSQEPCSEQGQGVGSACGLNSDFLGVTCGRDYRLTNSEPEHREPQLSEKTVAFPVRSSILCALF